MCKDVNLPMCLVSPKNIRMLTGNEQRNSKAQKVACTTVQG